MRIAFCNQHKTNNSSDWGQEGGREQWGGGVAAAWHSTAQSVWRGARGEGQWKRSKHKWQNWKFNWTSSFVSIGVHVQCWATSLSCRLLLQQRLRLCLSWSVFCLPPSTHPPSWAAVSSLCLARKPSQTCSWPNRKSQVVLKWNWAHRTRCASFPCPAPPLLTRSWRQCGSVAEAEAEAAASVVPSASADNSKRACQTCRKVA